MITDEIGQHFKKVNYTLEELKFIEQGLKYVNKF